MKKKTKSNKIYQGTYGKMRDVDDFLPSPEELVFRDSAQKVTITLSEHTVNYFKQKAKELNYPYQRLIRNLLDEYVEKVSN